MVFQRVRRSGPRNPWSAKPASRFAPRTFTARVPEDLESRALAEHQLEITRLECAQTHGTLTPARQDRLQVLQARMNDFRAQMLAQASRLDHPFVPTRSREARLPDDLKAGIESLSGVSMDDVKVHYDSARPAELEALACAQGDEIHLAPGEEMHLPHEAWHVAQQKQGRVVPNRRWEGAAINDAPALENEADVMGSRAARGPSAGPAMAPRKTSFPVAEMPAQRVKKNKKKRLDKEGTSQVTEEEPQNVMDEELTEWLQSEGPDESYSDEAKVHAIDKGDKKDLACWNWALRALSDEGGPAPADFWNFILWPGEEPPAWLSEVPETVQEEIGSLIDDIAKAKLQFDPFGGKKKYSSKQKKDAVPLLEQACRLIVQAHGFELASDDEAVGWIVCQYILAEGAAVPEHWWIELPGGVVIQTIPGENLEVGGMETRFHTAGARLSKSASQYGEIRVPVKALKGEHVRILREGMEAEKEKKAKKSKKRKRKE